MRPGNRRAPCLPTKSSSGLALDPPFFPQSLLSAGQQHRGLLQALRQCRLCHQVALIASKVALLAQAVQDTNRRVIDAPGCA